PPRSPCFPYTTLFRSVVAVIVSQLLGVDVTGLVGGGGAGGGTTQDQGQALEQCQTGQDANNSIECRMVGAATSLDDYWAGEAPRSEEHTSELQSRGHL